MQRYQSSFVADPLDELERRLSPQYRSVFGVLRAASTSRPDDYLSMQEIAESGWAEERRPRGPVQIKNSVQRAIYAIRMKLGPELILNDGANYKLNLKHVALAGPRIFSVGKRTQVDSEGSFEFQVREILKEAINSKSLSRLTFWGTRAALSLREISDDLLEAAEAGRRIRVVCSDGQLVIDVLAQMIWSHLQPLEQFVARFRGWIEFFIVAYPLGNGVAWIEYADAGSQVHAAGTVGDLTKLADGQAASAYIAPLTERLAQVRAMGPAAGAIVYVDIFDRTLAGQASMLRSYLQTLVDSTPGLEAGVIAPGADPPESAEGAD